MTAMTSGTAASSPAQRELWGAFIDGAFVAAAGAETFAVMEPATGRPLARVVSGGADLVEQAVASAWRALPARRDTPPRD
jgi:acyl-CoA reductase-like NAD-dependent aldehyde dehydrogenase